MIQADGLLQSVGRSGLHDKLRGCPQTAAKQLPEDRYQSTCLAQRSWGAFCGTTTGGIRRSRNPPLVMGFGSTGGNIGICWEHQAPTNQVPSLAPHYAGRTRRRHKTAIGTSRRAGISGPTYENSNKSLHWMRDDVWSVLDVSGPHQEFWRWQERTHV